MDYKLISDEDWVAQYIPIFKNESLKEFYWEDPRLQEAIQESRAWTLIDGDRGMTISSGIAVVNRMSFHITEKPFDPSCITEVKWFDWSDLDEEDDDD